MRLGIDVGSTTVKLVLTDETDKIIYRKYERHMSSVFEKVEAMLNEMKTECGNIQVKTVITGSGGLSLSEQLGVRFEQEVITCTNAVHKYIPDTDVVIELGGEDAKITFFGASTEQRMNGTCAGGTGAFIDQMAILLNMTGEELNEKAKCHTEIYPIAARCGVFAKSDIQPLINEGAPLENICASVFQAVVDQTISGLACGHRISGKVVFLGGPLTYYSELRNRFTETLGLSEENAILPENSKYYVALGASFLSEKEDEKALSELINSLTEKNVSTANTQYLEPLFKDREETEEFFKRHAEAKVSRGNMDEQTGPLFLGIDAGSTTTKAVVINDKSEVLFSFYENNQGNPLMVTSKLLKEIYDAIPEGAFLAKSTVTGYGEQLIKTGFHVDIGLIETMAHYKAAEKFLPGIDFILDIGGQDMKCLRMKDGSLYSMMLNEACSSGCGSFLETFSKSVGMPISEFANAGLYSTRPVDLGSRCTVFMNSMVKQAQKEGSGIDDIAAGLSYSVIKNALYKVIKLRNPEEAGEKIVVQGGTFLNSSVLRATEKILGRNVVRPDISGLMGAYGAALHSLENYSEDGESSILGKNELEDFNFENSNTRCGGCENHCLLTITKFSDGNRLISGNRCEKGNRTAEKSEYMPNLYEYKYHRLFDYEPLTESKAYRGHVAIPRVLNMYENYPFWFTLFTELGFRVVLSPASNKEIYKSGMDSISSDTVCYPAKLVHGHIRSLVDMGEKWIFYPCINYEYPEDPESPNHYNCPIVATFPEVIANNMHELFDDSGVIFSHPFLPYDNDERLAKRLTEFLADKGISKKEVSNAVKLARKEQNRFKEDIVSEGKRMLEFAAENGKTAIILAGRPYHLDPEINHGIDKLIASYDFVVLTEDSVADLKKLPRPIRVLDQWVYHSRLYKAANFAAGRDNVEVIQLNSFGCGIDAVTTDEVEELLRASNKIYTVLKIDEGTNLGAVRIRIRSLKAALEERNKKGIRPVYRGKGYERRIFTEKMREEYTIIAPQMSPIHFDYIIQAISSSGYNIVLVSEDDGEAVREGLKYVNNDACYPTLVTVGKMIAELKTGRYDPEKTALIMAQTGGGCRCSNYVSLIRKALKDMGMEQIPVISFNNGSLEKNPGFSITLKMLIKLLLATLYGDLFQRCLYHVRPYEVHEGEGEAIRSRWKDKILKNCSDGNVFTFWRNCKKIIREYDKVELKDIKKPKVGVVGEILVKYHPDANNHIVDLIEKEGGEAVVLEMMDFFVYSFTCHEYNWKELSGSFKKYALNNLAYRLIMFLRAPVSKELRRSRNFTAPVPVKRTLKESQTIASMGNQCGEGWLLTCEMVDLIHQGAANIACLQPFGCLPNHVTGKGMMKAIRERYPKANIVAIDYDPGASNVNQINRIKLMMAIAHKNNEV